VFEIRQNVCPPAQRATQSASYAGLVHLRLVVTTHKMLVSLMVPWQQCNPQSCQLVQMSPGPHRQHTGEPTSSRTEYHDSVHLSTPNLWFCVYSCGLIGEWASQLDLYKAARVARARMSFQPQLLEHSCLRPQKGEQVCDERRYGTMSAANSRSLARFDVN
jgi:hypothetical protein